MPHFSVVIYIAEKLESWKTLPSWNKLDEMVIFGKLEDFAKLESSTKLVNFTNDLPSWNNEKTQPYKLGLIYESNQKASPTFYK